MVVIALTASVLAGLMFGDKQAKEKGHAAFMCHVAGQCQAPVIAIGHRIGPARMNP